MNFDELNNLTVEQIKANPARLAAVVTGLYTQLPKRPTEDENDPAMQFERNRDKEIHAQFDTSLERKISELASNATLREMWDIWLGFERFKKRYQGDIKEKIVSQPGGDDAWLTAKEIRIPPEVRTIERLEVEMQRVLWDTILKPQYKSLEAQLVHLDDMKCPKGFAVSVPFVQMHGPRIIDGVTGRSSLTWDFKRSESILPFFREMFQRQVAGYPPNLDLDAYNRALEVQGQHERASLETLAPGSLSGHPKEFAQALADAVMQSMKIAYGDDYGQPGKDHSTLSPIDMAVGFTLALRRTCNNERELLFHYLPTQQNIVEIFKSFSYAQILEGYKDLRQQRDKLDPESLEAEAWNTAIFSWQDLTFKHCAAARQVWYNYRKPPTDFQLSHLMEGDTFVRMMDDLANNRPPPRPETGQGWKKE
jgi:hypothetical protein